MKVQAFVSRDWTMMKGRHTVTSGTTSCGRHLCLCIVFQFQKGSSDTPKLGATCQVRQIKDILWRVRMLATRVLESAKRQVLQPAARASGLYHALYAVVINTWELKQTEGVMQLLWSQQGRPHWKLCPVSGNCITGLFCSCWEGAQRFNHPATLSFLPGPRLESPPLPISTRAVWKG